MKTSLIANGSLVALGLLTALGFGEMILTWLNEPPLFRYYTRALEEVEAGDWAAWWVYEPGRGVYFDPAALTESRRSRLRNVSPNWARLDTVNAAGFHDADEFTADARDWHYRVLFVGDSFTWGASADVGRSFVELVETQLKRRRARSLVWNAAIPATGTEQAAVSVRELAPLMRPHVVVLGVFENDLNDNLYPLDRMKRTASGVAIAQYSWDKMMRQPIKEGPEYIKSSLRAQIDRNETGIYGVSRIANLVRNTWQATRDQKPRKVTEQKRWATRSQIRELKQQCAQYQAELLALLIPSRRTAIANETAEYRALESLLRSENVRIVSVRELLGSAHYANLPDNHWNNGGHAVAASVLVTALAGP